jgi:hypothetical protein
MMISVRDDIAQSYGVPGRPSNAGNRYDHGPAGAITRRRYYVKLKDRIIGWKDRTN